ncbi:MAG: HipA domain-containing protein [Deltaproteobacteria bacterium]|nr:HipA domain-containing protein [Deltaproteobacteria bacterium]
MDIKVQNNTFLFYDIIKIYSYEHLPFGIFKKNDSNLAKLTGLYKWWSSRLIPDNRLNIRHILDEFGVSSISQIAIKSFGLSLIDHYWVKPKNSDLKWQNINFYDNPFSEEANNVFLVTGSGNRRFKNQGEILGIKTPDSTTGGALIKKWTNIDGIPCLCKFGHGFILQDTANETIASLILDKLRLDHVQYSLKFFKKEPMSVCPNFLTKNTELISAEWMLRGLSEGSDQYNYDNFVLILNKLGLTKAKARLDDMLAFDYLIGNTDRHRNNFGIIRDSNTLEPLDLAPIFDNGASFWLDIRDHDDIPLINDIRCFPFADYHSEQIKFITDFSRINLKSITDMENDFYNIYNKLINFPSKRIEAIYNGFKKRIKLLEKIIENT